jgi:thermitase
MAKSADASVAPQDPYVVPDCGCGGKECFGPEPVPWLSWKHCFPFYEFRYGVIPLDQVTGEISHVGRLPIRIRYEHRLCLVGRKQGPIVHSLTLLPKEELRIYEYDRYRRATSTTERFSVRTSFFTMTQRVQEAYDRINISAGAKTSTTVNVSAGGGGGVDLGIVSFGAEASTSATSTASTHFDVASVSERFSHVAQTSSLAVESERSIVVSTFEEHEALHSTARTLRNDNECRAVTYFIRRVFEVYQLTTKIVGIEALVGDNWIDVTALPDKLQALLKKFLQKMAVGSAHDPKVEIALPTDGLLYEAELAHCCSCECEHEAETKLELEALQLKNLNLRLETERRKKRLDAGELDAFEPAPPVPAEA